MSEQKWTDEERQMEVKPLWGFHRIKDRVTADGYFESVEGNPTYLAISGVGAIKIARSVEHDYMQESIRLRAQVAALTTERDELAASLEAYKEQSIADGWAISDLERELEDRR